MEQLTNSNKDEEEFEYFINSNKNIYLAMPDINKLNTKKICYHFVVF